MNTVRLLKKYDVFFGSVLPGTLGHVVGHSHQGEQQYVIVNFPGVSETCSVPIEIVEEVK